MLFMQKQFFFSSVLTLLVVSFSSALMAQQETTAVKWYSWEEAVALHQKRPKKIFVDVYTSWCGWCKRMDKVTFSDSTVAAYLNKHFYPVKLDAEQRADIPFNGEVFKFVETGYGKGIHTLAYSLLDGRLSYPSMVYLNEKFERIMISPGYKEASDMLKELRFAAEEAYKTTTWEEYRNRKP